MQVYFLNPLGRVNFSPVGNGSIRITSISGLSNPEMRISSSFYAETGQTAVLSRYPASRIITVGGDILCGRQELSRISRILSAPGTLYITASGKRRKIYCDEVRFSTGERQGSFIKYSLALTCHNPYFSDFAESKFTVHSRSDLIYPQFTLPCVFTESVTRCGVINRGDIPSMPVFEIRALSGGDGGIIIENETTGHSLRIDHSFTAGELVAVDTQNRSITSSVYGNIINSLTPESVLGNMELICGCSNIRFIPSDMTADFQCICKFYPKYCEGEY